MDDLISRMDAVQATRVGPSDEWSRATKDGYELAATDIMMNVLKIPAADASPLGAVVKPLPRNESSRIGDWTIPADVLCAIRDEAGEWAEESYLETVECICLATEARILAALQPPNHAALLDAALALPEVAALVEAGKILAAMAARYDPPDGDDDLECWSGLAVPKIKHIRALRDALTALEARHE